MSAGLYTFEGSGLTSSVTRSSGSGTLQSRGAAFPFSLFPFPFSVSRPVRRALIVYLAAYYLLIAAAVVTLWRSGLMAHLHRGWTYSAIAFAVALGLVLWVTSRR